MEMCVVFTDNSYKFRTNPDQSCDSWSNKPSGNKKNMTEKFEFRK